MTVEVSKEARLLHEDAFVADLHVDSFLIARQFGYDFLKRHSAWLPGGALFSHTDLPRMREGGVDFIAFGVVVNPLLKPKNCFPSALRQIELFHDACKRSDGELVQAESPEAALEAKKKGIRCGFLGMEGAHDLGGELENVVKAHELGVRYITLTHFSSNQAASCAKGLKANPQAGLTDWGRDLIMEMNRVGVIVDVAHVNRPGFLDAVRLSKSPCLVSHGGVTGAMPHWRNIDDDMLRALADKGGTVGVIFSPSYITNNKRLGAKAIFRHIDHIVQTVGEDHASIGSDFDGYIPTPFDLRDTSDMPRITQLMLENGYSEERIRKILGLNFLRVWQDCRTMAQG